MVSLVPDSAQGPLLGLVGVATAVIVIAVSWLLLKPLFVSSRRANRNSAK